MAVKKLSELTVAELKHELKKRKLEVVGDKATLLARLKKSLVEDGKFKAAAKNKTTDQQATEKTPINNESTSQESKDDLNSQINSCEESATPSCDLEITNTSLNQSTLASNDILKEKANLASVSMEQNDSTKPDETSKSLTQTVPLVTSKDLDAEKSANDDKLVDPIKSREEDNKTLSDNDKIADQVKSEGESDVKPQLEIPNEVVKPVEENNVDMAPTKCAPTPALNDNTVITTQNLESGDKEKTKTDSLADENNPLLKSSEAVKSHESDGSNVKNESNKKDEIGKPSPETSKTLWITGLVGAIKASDLKQAFGKHGKVLSAKIVTSAKNPGSKCFGLITMQTYEDAKACITNFHNKVLLGSSITVEFDVKQRIARPIQQPAVTSADKNTKVASSNADSSTHKTPEKQDGKEQEVSTGVSNEDSLTTSTPIAGSKPIAAATITPIVKPVATKSSDSINGSNASSKNAVDTDKNTVEQPSAATNKATSKKENESTSVWLSGLPSKVKAADLKTLCLIAGKVLAAKVVASSKSVTYFGLVTMSSVDEAKDCVTKLDKYVYEGKVISCELAPYDNVTPELLKHFSKIKISSDAAGNKNEDKKEEESNEKDCSSDENKTEKSSTNNTSDTGSTKASQNAVKNRSDYNSSKNSNNNRNSGNFRRRDYNRYRDNRRNIPSLLESNPYNVARANKFSSSLFGVDPISRNYGGNFNRNRQEQERLDAEHAKLLLFQEQQRQQQMSAFRGDRWGQPPSRMKRIRDSDDDLYWGPPPNQSSSKRSVPQSLFSPPFGDHRIGSGPQNFW